MNPSRLFILLVVSTLFGSQAACGFIGANQCDDSFLEHCEGNDRVSCYHGAENNEVVRDPCGTCVSLRPDTAVCRPRTTVTSCASTAPVAATRAIEAYPQDPNAAPTVAASDMNGDGRADLVAVQDQGVVVLLNRGDGTFEPHVTSVPSPLSLTWRTVTLFTGDIDADGKSDVVLADGTALFPLRGIGDGRLAPAQTVQAASRFRAVAAVDIDGDRAADIVGVKGGIPAAWRASGQTFVEAAAAPWRGEPRLGVGDVDGDKSLDLLDGTHVLFSDGDASLPFSLDNGPTTTSRLADVDGDGKDDVVFTSVDTSSQPSTYAVTIAFGPTVGSNVTLPASLFATRALAIADVDGDGIQDVLGSDAEAGIVVLWRGLGGRRWEAPRAATLAPDRGTLALAVNLYGDDKPELVIAGEHGLYVVAPGCF